MEGDCHAICIRTALDVPRQYAYITAGDGCISTQQRLEAAGDLFLRGLSSGSMLKL